MEQEIPCDPALLSCISPDEIRLVLPFIFAIAGAGLIWRFIRSELHKINGRQPRRGTAPGDGYSVKTINITSNGNGRDTVVQIRHTKDPQKHARAMMPATARKKEPK